MANKAVLSDFTLRVASASQHQEGLRAAHEHWGVQMGMNEPDFLEWWNSYARHDSWLTKEAGYVQYWVLVRRDDYDGPIYTFCMTYRRQIMMKEPGSKEIQQRPCYAVSAVVTPKQHHRKGYATHLCRLLHYQLASPSVLPPFPTSEWGPPPPPLSAEVRAQLPEAAVSILFSGVGSTFYERATIGSKWPGWVTRDDMIQALTWKLSPPTAAQAKISRPARDWIYTRDLPAIGEILARERRKELLEDYEDSTRAVWASDPSSTGILSYVPSQIMRPRSDDFHTVYDTEPCGIRLPGIRPGQEDAIVLFVHSEHRVARGTLITYVHNLDEERLPLLLEALDEASADSKLGLDEGVVWGILPDSPLGKAWAEQTGREAKISKRPEQGGNLFAVAWYGNPEDRGELVDTQIWNYS